MDAIHHEQQPGNTAEKKQQGGISRAMEEPTSLMLTLHHPPQTPAVSDEHGFCWTSQIKNDNYKLAYWY